MFLILSMCSKALLKWRRCLWYCSEGFYLPCYVCFYILSQILFLCVFLLLHSSHYQLYLQCWCKNGWIICFVFLWIMDQMLSVPQDLCCRITNEQSPHFFLISTCLVTFDFIFSFYVAELLSNASAFSVASWVIWPTAAILQINSCLHPLGQQTPPNVFLPRNQQVCVKQHATSAQKA